MKVNHVAIVNDWDLYEVFENAEILILGSFNPYNLNGDNADYYYGRCSNYFWRAIAELNNMNPNIFFNNLELKLFFTMQYKFYFLDLINSVEITSDNQDNQEDIQHFLNTKIYSNFSDQILFTTNTRFNNTKIYLKREYNKRIIQLLTQGRIKKIIHTLGNITINQEFKTKWGEKKLKDKGFQGFVEQIIKNSTNIEFDKVSYSPSSWAVKRGGSIYFNNLKSWLNLHLKINKN